MSAMTDAETNVTLFDALNAARNDLAATLAHRDALQAEVDRLKALAVDAFDEAVAAELPRVSHIEYDSHEICKHFAGEVRKRLEQS